MSTIRPPHMRGAEVDAWIGIGKSTRHEWQNPKSPYHDPTWPLPIRLGARKTVYITEEIEAWLKSRLRARDLHGEKDGA
ncbi:AlpA family transcriptional regulator [Cupriavidus sp. SW-Y-13]|uniref:helix-turn-helix transcriptional regulator n=1 Tax=Cupriavidus sp. SW-Y-13 TaxID=2653854 RepID=UPI0013652FA3|nr:AlpA family phage regulatory protein [Cupriavidus sp. SW-Y-13]MWL88599.1 AlpA family phage regulatory protein [Cupriavidus sp. SW-Y-13]